MTPRRNPLLTLITAAATCSIIAGAQAANVVISNDSDPHPIALANGTLVPDGTGFVSVGTFNLTDGQISQAMNSQANLDAVSSVFREFATGQAFGIGGEGGVYSAAFENPISNGDMFDGMPIFVVAGNGTNIGNSDQLWIFRSGEAFGADGVDDFSARIELDAEFAQGSELIGTPDTLFLPGAGQSFPGSRMVALIPEPSTGALVALLGLVLVARRRR